MKSHRSSIFHISSVLLALTLPLWATAPAHADLFKKIKKETNKATHAVEHEAKKDANAVSHEAEKDAKTVKDGVTGAANTVANGGKQVFSASELKDVREVATKSYTATAKAGESAYRQTVAAVKAGIDAAKNAALRAAAQAYLRKYKGFLGKLRHNIDELAKDDSARAIVNRVVKAASEKRLDDQTRADLLVLGERLGLLEWSKNSIVPSSSGGSFKSSWGIAVGANAAYGLGAEGSFGLVANCYKEPDQRYGAGLAVGVGGVLGLSVGGAADVTIYWQPGGVSDAEGGYIGLGLEGAYAEIGGTVGVQWSVSEGMKGAAAAIPGFYLGWAGGGELSLGLEGGYTWVPVKSTK